MLSALSGGDAIEILVALKNLASSGITSVEKDLAGLEAKANGVNLSGFSNATKSLGTDAEKAAGGGGGGIGSLIGAFTGLINPITLGIAAVAGAGALMAAAIPTYEKVEQQQNALGAAFKATGQSLTDLQPKIDATISSNEKYGINADDTRAAILALTQAGHNWSDINASMPAILDLAQAHHLSLADAATQVEQAEVGNARAMKSLGIVLPPLTKAQKDGADMGARQALVLEAITSRLGDATNTATPMQVVQAKLNDTWEKFAMAVGPAAVTIFGFILGVVGNVLDVITSLIGTASDIIGWVASLGPVQDFFKDLGRLVQSAFGLIGQVAGAISGIIGAVTSVVSGAVDTVTGKSKQIVDTVAAIPAQGARALAGEQDALGPPIEAMFQPLGKIVDPLVAQIVTTVADAPGDMAKGILAARALPKDAFDQLLADMKTAMTPAAEIARLHGELISKQLKAGLKSGDPAVKAQAEDTKALILARLVELQGVAKTYGQNTMSAYAAGLDSPASLRAISRATGRAVDIIVQNLKAFSPPGPASPLHLIDLWGGKAVEAYAGGMESGVPSVSSAVAKVTGAIAGPMTTVHAGLGGGGGLAQHCVHNVTLMIDGHVLANILDQINGRQIALMGTSALGGLGA